MVTSINQMITRAKVNGFLLNFRPGCYLLKVMLQEMIRNDDFEHNTTR